MADKLATLATGAWKKLERAEHLHSMWQFLRGSWHLITNPLVSTSMTLALSFVGALATGQSLLFAVIGALVIVVLITVLRGAYRWNQNLQRFGPQLEAISQAAKAPPEIQVQLEYTDPPDYQWLKQVRDYHLNLGPASVFPKTRREDASLPLTLWVRVHRLEPDLVLVGEYFNKSIFDLEVSKVLGKLVIPDIGSFGEDVLRAEGQAPATNWFQIAIYVTIKTETARQTILEKIADKQSIAVDLQNLQVRMKLRDRPLAAEIHIRLADEWNPEAGIRRAANAS